MAGAGRDILSPDRGHPPRTTGGPPLLCVRTCKTWGKLCLGFAVFLASLGSCTCVQLSHAAEN